MKKEEENVKFVVRREDGRYWSGYHCWTKSLADAHFFSRPGSAKSSVARAPGYNDPPTSWRIERVEVQLKVLDTVFVSS